MNEDEREKNLSHLAEWIRDGAPSEDYRTYKSSARARARYLGWAIDPGGERRPAEAEDTEAGD